VVASSVEGLGDGGTGLGDGSIEFGVDLGVGLGSSWALSLGAFLRDQEGRFPEDGRCPAVVDVLDLPPAPD
jgi:hypothetical protein